MQKPIARMRLLQTAKTKTAYCDVTFETEWVVCMCVYIQFGETEWVTFEFFGVFLPIRRNEWPKKGKIYMNIKRQTPFIN